MPANPSTKPRARILVLLLIVLSVVCLSLLGLSGGLPQASGGSAVAGVPPVEKQSSIPDAPDLPRGSRIPWQDGSYFLSGVNYPWYRYYGGDVATLASVDPDCNWIYDSAFDYEAIDTDFAEMQAGGTHVARWFLFGDGRGAPEFDTNRRVTGFDATFYDHMDQVMEIAARHNIYIIWTLWDFLAFKPANWLCGGTALGDAYSETANLPPPLRDIMLTRLKMAQAAPTNMLPGSAPVDGQSCMIYAGGHRNIVTDTNSGGAQDSFFNNALIPMLQRYANHRNIIGWEIMNEPEWTLNPNAYTGWQYPTVEEPVDVDQMRAFFARFTQAVHTYAPNQYATVGGASLKFMGLGQNIPPGIWSGLGFDYYGAHYYGWMESSFNNGSPMTIDYNTTQQQLDAPVVIGELPANGGTAPVYLPSIRRSVTETSTLSLRYICTAYAPGGDPPCSRPYTAKIQYYNANGTAALTQMVVIPPYGGWTGSVPEGAGNFAGAARILSNGPVAAVITQTGILSAGEQVAYAGQDQGNLTTWLPFITNQGMHRSRIAIQNTGVHTATVAVNYYNGAGTAVATDNLALAPRGSALIDPLLPGSPPGPPAGFQGSAVIVGTRPLVAVAYELDSQMGSDAYNGEGQGYLHAVYLPLVRNWGVNGNPTLYVQNPCCAAANTTVSYYNYAGTMVASQALTLPAYGSAAVQPQAVLGGGFEGTVIITSDQYPAAVMRSVTTNGPVNTTELYAGTQYPDQRLHFPIVNSMSGGSGPDTSFAVQNVSPSSPITLWVMLNDNSGGSVFFSNAIPIPPRGQWVASTSSLPGVPSGFSGTAEILWPWPSSTGWSEGFPLLATALDIDGAHSRGSTYRGITSHSQYWAVTPYTADELLEGIYNKHWAGALGWSFYDYGTGSWDDLQAAISALDAAHPADVRIGQTIYTPEPTPGNGSTATALAATNTPAYGNSATATAVAQTGTPQPPCAPCSIFFSDVPTGHTFYASIMCLACQGIVSGYSDGTFRPENLVTRGQLAKIVSNAANFQEDPGAQIFQDVPPAHTFYQWINRLSNRGHMSGYPCGGPGEPCVENRPYFRPGNSATRGQTSKIVSNAASFTEPPVGQTFEDAPPSHPFYEWIQRLASRGIMNGYQCGGPGEPCGGENRPYFRPGNLVTRGQSAKIVANSFFPGCSP